MSKCKDCGRNLIEEDDIEWCQWCEDIHEGVVSKFRHLPKDVLNKLASGMCPFPRMVWPGELMVDAQFREFVVSEVRREKERRILIDGTVEILEECDGA